MTGEWRAVLWAVKKGGVSVGCWDAMTDDQWAGVSAEVLAAS